MAIVDALLPEFDQEMAGTRKTLERVPDDKFDWKPHEKSTAMGALASHLAHLPTWISLTVHQDSFDMAPDGQPVRNTEATSTAELLERFDRNIAEARAALAGATDEQLLQKWSLLMTGREIFTIPKAAVVRTFVLSHTIHHRAQLGVYLRLNDVAVPSIYGPSADENPFF